MFDSCSCYWQRPVQTSSTWRGFALHHADGTQFGRTRLIIPLVIVPTENIYATIDTEHWIRFTGVPVGVGHRYLRKVGSAFVVGFPHKVWGSILRINTLTGNPEVPESALFLHSICKQSATISIGFNHQFVSVILGVQWPVKITNKDLYRQTGQESVLTQLRSKHATCLDTHWEEMLTALPNGH